LNPTTTAEAFSAYQSVRHRLPAVARRGGAKHMHCLDDIADQFDVFLLDAFGVLNIGDSAIKGVPERVAALQAAGKQVVVVTNAAGYPKSALMAKYARLGYKFDPDGVISSRMALLHGLQSETPRRWGIMATLARGREDFEYLDTVFLGENPDDYDRVEGFLLMGSAAWTEARQALLEQSLQKHPRPVFVGNPDIVAPREGGFSIEPGHYAHRLARATGIEPVFFGKPYGNHFDLALARVASDQDRRRIVMVGDSLHTDILGGLAAGIQTALISDFGFFAGADCAAAIATSGIVPDYILDRP